MYIYPILYEDTHFVSTPNLSMIPPNIKYSTLVPKNKLIYTF